MVLNCQFGGGGWCHPECGVLYVGPEDNCGLIVSCPTEGCQYSCSLQCILSFHSCRLESTPFSRDLATFIASQQEIWFLCGSNFSLVIFFGISWSLVVASNSYRLLAVLFSPVACVISLAVHANK